DVRHGRADGPVPTGRRLAVRRRFGRVLLFSRAQVPPAAVARAEGITIKCFAATGEGALRAPPPVAAKLGLTNERIDTCRSPNRSTSPAVSRWSPAAARGWARRWPADWP